MSFPSVFSTFNRPNPTDRLNNPSHSALHNTVSSAVGQLEAVIGQDGNNSVLGTLIGDLRSPGSPGGGHVQTANKGGTGQVTYSKGDILIASSASVLTKLSLPGIDNYSLTTDQTQFTGIKWAPSGGNQTTQYYTTPSIFTWVKPSVISFLMVEIQGPGAGGGQGTTNNNGGSGGAGAYARKIIPGSSILTSYTVRVGTGGLGHQNSAGSGNDGSVATLFGSVLIAGPGAGGGQSSGGSGGSVLAAGDLNINGQDGMTNGTTNTFTKGGDSFYGSGGIVPGGKSTGFGSGGAAGNANATNGSNGGDGLVIITFV